MNKSYADVLESYMIVEEGLFSNIIKFFKKKKDSEAPKKSSVDYKEYLDFIYEVFEKIPADAITKERNLRKKEVNQLVKLINESLKAVKCDGTGNCLQVEPESKDFAQLKYATYGFEEVFVTLVGFDGYEFMKKKYPQIDYNSREYADIISTEFDTNANKIEKMIKELISKYNIKCIHDVHNDWDKFEGGIFAVLKPSKEFLSIAREYGYITREQYEKTH